MTIIACSLCFKDFGLQLEAQKHGTKQESECPICKNIIGAKLTRQDLEYISYIFFVRGSMHYTEYVGAPVIQFNAISNSSVDFYEHLAYDVKLICDILKINFFYYGPRLCHVGEIDKLHDLKNVKTRKNIIAEVIDKYPHTLLTDNDIFFRIRKDPRGPLNITEYDSPPKDVKRKKYGRLDSAQMAVMYGSKDLDLCVHECRFVAGDNLYVATLSPRQNLKILDLSSYIEEEGTEFESLGLAITMLFLAAEHSYEISRDLAKQVCNYGFDGIYYPSFFSTLRNGSVPFESSFGMQNCFLEQKNMISQNEYMGNIALFGHPIKDKKICVNNINRLKMMRVDYHFSFGAADY